MVFFKKRAPMVLLELKRIRKKFGRREVLVSVDLSVKKGEILGLLGPNGSGKTTTLRIAAGFYSPDSGSVLIGGQPFGPESDNGRSKVGYLPERPPLYDSLTLNNYLKFIARAKHIPRPDRYLAIEKVMKLCHLEQVAKQPIVQFSKGFRQRVGLAQAILGDPDVLLLDEPTNGLDPVQIIEARHVIGTLSADRAVLFCSHIIQEVAALCSRVVMIREGRLLAIDKPKDSSETGQ